MNVLRLNCEDKPGIVAAVATTLSHAECNIEESSQFFDPLSEQFFMRVMFRPLVDGAAASFMERFADIAVRFGMRWDVCELNTPVKTLILVSKADHCLHDLLYRVRAKGLSIHITGIVSNHLDLEPMAVAAGIPYYYFAMEEGKPAQEARIADLIESTGSELILLARYMQVFSQQMCSKYHGQIINIHHSFLPGFKGAKPYSQAYERGVKIIGATAHYATLDLDEGPIIAQDVETVDHAALPEKLQQIGKDIETRVLARAVSLYTERRIFVHGNRTIIL